MTPCRTRRLPGYLAPGVSSEVVVTFTPKANADLATSLQLLSDTGPFQLPVRCTTKRAAVSVSAPPGGLDFGPGVTLGESVTKTFEIRNDGALDVEFRLDSPQLSDDERALLKSAANMGTLLTSTAVAALAASAASAHGNGFGHGMMSRASHHIGGAAAPEVAPREDRRLVHSGFSVFPCVGLLRGYGRVVVTATFSPVLAMPAKLQLRLNFK